MRPPIVLTEYAPSAPLDLTVTERDALRGLVPNLTVEPIAGSTDTYRITGGSSVGVVRVGDLTIEFRPKIGIAPLLFLVSYTLNPKAWRQSQAELASDTNLAEAIVPLFGRTAQAALQQGLLHGYRTQQDTLPTIRGRVRMADQMRSRTGLPMPIEVSYDDFTPDILENRLLRTAVDVLGRLRLRHQASRLALARLNQQLAGIGNLTVDGRPVPEPVWTRLNERYRPAVSLARLIVTTAGLAARAGGIDASAFIVDMNAVFEGFVRAAMREHLRLDTHAFPPGASGHRIYLDTGRFIPLKPDLSWWVGGRCVFAGDCKYKRPSNTVPNADIYQMFAYLTALQLPEGLLIYAPGEDIPPDVVIEQAAKRIQVQTVDVSKPPDQILEQVEELAKRARHIASSSIARSFP